MSTWLETQALSALGSDKPLGYATPVAATWDLSLGRLKDTVTGSGAAAADPGVLLTGANLHDPALQRRDDRAPAAL